MSDLVHGLQYTDHRHQAETARAGMWLFLATEALFFGAVVLCWVVVRHLDPAGFDAGGRKTDLTIGVVNTVVLLSSGVLYSLGLVLLEAGSTRGFSRCAMATMLCGAVFLGLKFGVEWRSDFARDLFPTHGGPPGGSRLFFVFYFVATGLHALHMIAGIVLVGWVRHRVRTEARAQVALAAEMAGLYWSFVDMVWLVLFPLIYLVAR